MEVEKIVERLVMVEDAALTRMPELNVCSAVQVLAFPRLRDATTAPAVGEIVKVESEFDTEVTAPWHTLFTAKHPPSILMPKLPTKVEVADP